MTTIETTSAPADNAQFRSAAKSYLTTYDGPVKHKTIIFGSRMVKQMYKREHLILPRNALATTYFARLQFGDEIIDPLEDALNKKIDSLLRKFENQIGQYKVLMKEANLTDEDLASNNLPEAYDAEITSPLYGAVLRLMQKADQVHIYIDTLWLEGVIKTPDFGELRVQLKRDVRGVSTFIRNTWIALQKRVQAGKLAEIKASLGGEEEVADAPKKRRAKAAAPAADAVPAATQGDLIPAAVEAAEPA